MSAWELRQRLALKIHPKTSRPWPCLPLALALALPLSLALSLALSGPCLWHRDIKIPASTPLGPDFKNVALGSCG